MEINVHDRIVAQFFKLSPAKQEDTLRLLLADLFEYIADTDDRFSTEASEKMNHILEEMKRK